MLRIVISHSKSIADGVKELVVQMVSERNLAVAGGTFYGRIGIDITYNRRCLL